MTVTAELTRIREILHDSGTLWSDAYLTRQYNDGYRQVLAQSGCVTRLLPLDLPGRHTYALCFPWEDRHASGTYWFPFLPTFGTSRQATSAWEVEMLEGITPTVSLQAITAQWERAHSGDVQAHFEFGLPKDHERIRRLAWDDKLLIPSSVREFDEVDDAWMRREGEPTWWITGLGRIRTVEVYELKTDYNHPWSLLEYEKGIPRQFSGRTYSVTSPGFAQGNSYGYTTSADAQGLQESNLLIPGFGWRFTRVASTVSNGFTVHIWEKQQLDGDTLTASVTVGTFAWEVEFGASSVTFGLGTIRGATSPDRQYLPMLTDGGIYDFLGGVRAFASTEDALSCWEVVIPQRDLVGSDESLLLPLQMKKYLRYYVLSRAFAKDGEGQRQDLAVHYEARFRRGVALMKRLADVAHKDRLFVRDTVAEGPRRPPLVRLPSEFPAVW